MASSRSSRTSRNSNDLLLDTHVWLWAAEDERRRLGPRTRRLLARVPEAVTAFISAASVFEITALHTEDRVRLSQPIERWIRESIDAGSLRVVDLTPSIAIDAGMIPSSAVADPIDRLLIATARDRGLTFVTRDARLLDFASTTRFARLADAAR